QLSVISHQLSVINAQYKFLDWWIVPGQVTPSKVRPEIFVHGFPNHSGQLWRLIFLKTPQTTARKPDGANLGICKVKFNYKCIEIHARLM
ncbi:MAG TPA: hypothetical protein DEF27_04205, partial [Oscillatoriales bacterium UBA8482]|nr:hypothetical protein [Oscillatoriales bacterium UBA8482]